MRNKVAKIFSQQIREIKPFPQAPQTVDINKSYGSRLYVVKDGNINNRLMLDMRSQIASLPLGYNNKDLKERMKEENDQIYTHRLSLGVNAPYDYQNKINDTFGKIAPNGLDVVVPICNCGSGSIENALKMAMYNYASKYGFLDNVNTSKIVSYNTKNTSSYKTPATIISFSGGFHGRTLGALSCTRTDPNFSINLPRFNWQCFDYPPSHMVDYKLKQEIIMDKFEKSLQNNSSRIAAVIVEPFQAEGGDRWASNEFYEFILSTSRKYGIMSIVDEVQSGVAASGKWWASDYWNVRPDAIVFAKKAQIGGIITRDEFLPKHDKRIFNTYLGDYMRTIVLKHIIDIIEENDLMNNMIDFEIKFKRDFDRFSNGSFSLTNLRGKGGLMSFNVEDGKAGQFVNKMKDNGVLLMRSGPEAAGTIRLRPPLTFSDDEYEQFIDTMSTVVRL